MNARTHTHTCALIPADRFDLFFCTYSNICLEFTCVGVSKMYYEFIYRYKVKCNTARALSFNLVYARSKRSRLRIIVVIDDSCLFTCALSKHTKFHQIDCASSNSLEFDFLAIILAHPAPLTLSDSSCSRWTSTRILEHIHVKFSRTSQRFPNIA